MATIEVPTEKDTQLAGIGLLLAGLFIASLNGALMKILTPVLPEVQIVWGRYVAYFIVMLPIGLYRFGLSTFSPPRPGRQIVRALLLVVATTSFVAAAGGLPFADAIAIIYIYPFIITLLAPWLLKERVSLPAWIGVIGGFAGVLIVMRPSFDNIDVNTLFALSCGVFLALHLITTRQLALTTSPIITSTFTAFVSLLVLCPIVPFVWQPVPLWTMGIFALVGLTSAASHGLILLAYARAPAPTLAPFSYAEILAAVFIGLALFSDLPDRISWVGMTIIIASGVLVAQTSRAKLAIPSRRAPPGP